MPAKATVAGQSVEIEQIQRGGVLTLSAGHAVHDTYAAFLSPLLPAFIENLALSKTEAGLLSVFYQIPSLLQPAIGHLADRVSLRHLVIVAPAAIAVSMSLLGVAPAYGFLALLLTVAGIASATLHAVGPAMTGKLSGSKLGQGMGLWMVGGELGRTLGPLVVVTAIQFLTLRGTPWLMVGGFVASLLLYLRLKGVSGSASHSQVGLPQRPALRAMASFLVPLVGLLLARAFFVVALGTFLPTFLTEEGADLWFAGVSLSILEGAGVVGALVGGSLSDRLGRRRMIAASLVGTPILMLAFLATAGWVRFPLLVLLGLVALSITPVLMAVVQETFPENRALANGVYQACNFLIRSGAVVVLGVISDRFSMHTAFAVSAVIPLVGLPFLRLLPSKEPRG